MEDDGGVELLERCGEPRQNSIQFLVAQVEVIDRADLVNIGQRKM